MRSMVMSLIDLSKILWCEWNAELKGAVLAVFSVEAGKRVDDK